LKVNARHAKTSSTQMMIELRVLEIIASLMRKETKLEGASKGAQIRTVNNAMLKLSTPMIPRNGKFNVLICQT
jgi:hypothetical protein